MILNAFDLAGKVALVTGCNTGLGQGMAIGLAQAGCDIVGVNLSSPNETAEKVTALGRRFLDLRADLGSIEGIPQLIEKAVGEFGHLDILVNNAGIIRREDAIEFSEKNWDDVMNVNSKTLFFMSQAVARQFIKQGHGGKIINIASMLSYQGGIRVPSYTASKSAVMGITRLMANEWAKHGINVNAIAPGYMATNNTEQLRADEGRSKEILERIPAGRWGVPEDVMGPVVFLASKASDYVNGYTVAVDGGWLAR
ncbi:MAG: 2-dehydro-3-deoxy-D-gluconate 5-dehydrogenase KduD [Ewingella americana]|jgi:2-deoxy-D-gluconate 3-dehydrogenase|uniref:2-dehydro-3-deoxy-D-gluconate 5-dehydrogenase n=2 Tax=Ewingella americana TaxID=41202 RepID=A0A085GAN2_EWIA3|nr:2-dehydro-3-deoxy-D-gluconate 5-dehydrogenase KduD [Ewingella americana]KAA8730156.1 2-dehydro-3-deoxy-D-gluconate 5-dehydrogenase KduD [Ewingella americana]KFC80777.1 2-deoxy-D-gluconate 3-dehydrogenase [Ewingella americana ATCC 33852]MCI1679020.1 2-dehydro-3-deoxy-D-gluconate 5-dehydrogenase KduD [Ewingella americana]MCI1852336.1 2-dehydro-3-deoxy-D-gluconate 5-dehydrogenase KduD [Ewingella americana]MCI1862738.1 2-dehydro-3-deoxy-D-gluconate 5-dehydrogenase KduD [Ewingella americana]